jgi:hypothetical protein
VAADLGCSWNRTSGDLQGAKEKTRERRNLEIILDQWIQGDRWQRSTHIGESRIGIEGRNLPPKFPKCEVPIQARRSEPSDLGAPGAVDPAWENFGVSGSKDLR